MLREAEAGVHYNIKEKSQLLTAEVTRIRTWVAATTKQSTNHYTITAACFSEYLVLVITYLKLWISNLLLFYLCGFFK